MFVENFSLLCSCFRLPPNGRFTVGKKYLFEYLIDARRVVDDFGGKVELSENIFQSCFDHIEKAVTSYSPIFADRTTYHVYLMIFGSSPTLEEVKAYAKTMQLNYIQARKALVYGRNLVSSQNACHTGETLKKLKGFQVKYEIEPAYPYPI